MSSLPPQGVPIVVTTTSTNGEVGKFLGTYESHNGQFVLKPLPDKYHIFQLPMYKNQYTGWMYAYSPDEGKDDVDPNQKLVEVRGLTRMEFPHKNYPFTWSLLEDEPLMNVHQGVPVNVRKEIETILQSDDRIRKLGQLATKYPEHKDSIIRIMRSEKELQKILNDDLTVYGKVMDLRSLHAMTPDFKSHIANALSQLEPIAEVTQSSEDSHTKIKRLSSMAANPEIRALIKGEIDVLRHQPPPPIQDEITEIVRRGRHADPHIRRLMLYHLSKMDSTHALFAPAIMHDLNSFHIIEDLGTVADEVSSIFESTDLFTVLHRLKTISEQHPEYRDKLEYLIHASITDEIDFIDRKSSLDTSGKIKALGGLMNTLVQFPDPEIKNLIYQRIKRLKGSRKRRKRRTQKK
jgi:hypothetical protein